MSTRKKTQSQLNANGTTKYTVASRAWALYEKLDKQRDNNIIGPLIEMSPIDIHVNPEKGDFCLCINSNEFGLTFYKGNEIKSVELYTQGENYCIEVTLKQPNSSGYARMFGNRFKILTKRHWVRDLTIIY